MAFLKKDNSAVVGVSKAALSGAAVIMTVPSKSGYVSEPYDTKDSNIIKSTYTASYFSNIIAAVKVKNSGNVLNFIEYIPLDNKIVIKSMPV